MNGMECCAPRQCARALGTLDQCLPIGSASSHSVLRVAPAQEEMSCFKSARREASLKRPRSWERRLCTWQSSGHLFCTLQAHGHILMALDPLRSFLRNAPRLPILLIELRALAPNILNRLEEVELCTFEWEAKKGARLEVREGCASLYESCKSWWREAVAMTDEASTWSTWSCSLSSRMRLNWSIKCSRSSSALYVICLR